VERARLRTASVRARPGEGAAPRNAQPRDARMGPDAEVGEAHARARARRRGAARSARPRDAAPLFERLKLQKIE
jgi:hypothetical protein